MASGDYIVLSSGSIARVANPNFGTNTPEVRPDYTFGNSGFIHSVPISGSHGYLLSVQSGLKEYLSIGGILPVYAYATGSDNRVGVVGATGSFASVATSGDYSALSGKPVLATVALSGSYVDLFGQPPLPPTVGISPIYAYTTGSNVNVGIVGATGSLATVATSGNFLDLSNKPAAQVHVALAPVYTYATGSNVTTGAIPPVGLSPVYVTTTGSSPNIGIVGASGSLATVATSGNFLDLSNKPTVPVTSVAGKTGAVTLAIADLFDGNNVALVDGANNFSNENRFDVDSGLFVITSGGFAVSLSNSGVRDTNNSFPDGSGPLALFSEITKDNVGLAAVENTALSTWAGTTSITTLGTVATGTWSGSAIALTKGGTGATTASGARTNLGLATVASSGSYADLSGTPSAVSGANPTGTVGLTAVNGVAATFLRSDGAPAISASIAPTWTGIHTFTPTERTSGVAAYLAISTPADTSVTASTEGAGIKLTTGTRTWATTGTVALQREIFFAGPTYASASASQTFTDVFNLYLTPPVAGSNAIFTRGHTLGIVDSTSAASAITGGLVVATTLGTDATSVGIGGGNVYAGGNIFSTSGFYSATYLSAGSKWQLDNNGFRAISTAVLGFTTSTNPAVLPVIAIGRNSDTCLEVNNGTLGVYRDLKVRNITADDLGTPLTLTLTNATGLPAGGIGSGTVATARLGTGTANSSSFLRGDQTWTALTVPTVATTSVALKGDGAGNAVAITNSNDALIVQTMADVNTTIANTTDVLVLGTALTALRAITLPAASSFTNGRKLRIVGNGKTTVTNYITIQRGGSDTYNGSTSALSWQGASAAPGLFDISLYSDGSSKWLNGFSLRSTSGGTAANTIDNPSGSFTFTEAVGFSSGADIGGNAAGGSCRLTLGGMLTFSNDNYGTTYQVLTGVGKGGAQGVVEINSGTTGGFGALKTGWVVTAKTANYPVLLADKGMFFTNTGAAGTVNFTLPTAQAGLQYSFYVDAAQSLTITAAASTTIRIAGNITAAAGNITANTVGNCVRLMAISATKWVAESHEGTWTIN